MFLVDKILYPLAVISPMFTLPQFYKVWFLKQSDGVSSVSWFLMCFMAVLWFFHACKHKDKLLMLNTCIMIIINFFIAFGAIIY